MDHIQTTLIEEQVVKHPDRAEALRIFNYPFAAIEEAVAKAVYHRSYEIREPIEVRILPDRMVVPSFPGPDRLIRDDDLKKYHFVARRYLNRRIGEFLKELDMTEGRGKRESLYRFWEDGLESKSGKGMKGIFVFVKTLVGTGSGTVGLDDKGRRLTEYILDAVKEQMQVELGKNISLYPVELLADRFISDDIAHYRKDLAKFLRDPRFFDQDEIEYPSCEVCRRECLKISYTICEQHRRIRNGHSSGKTGSNVRTGRTLLNVSVR